jgi:hypothetical protein
VAGAGYSSSWFSQIGLTAAIETQARGGAGVMIALIDTGADATSPEIAGRVSNLSSCAALTFTCSNGFADDHGHGTATASIAAGSLNSQDLMSGVAPAATVLIEKVLDQNGSGYDIDVANGIIKAADAGAPVISLSLTYIPTPDVVNAINYATAKGAVIVWAGGNSSAPLNGGANTTGLTATTLSHLILVGSVSSSNALSWFSNTPGAARAVAGTASAGYAQLWLMAPGESIWAPAIQFGGNSVYSTWTGTSMSTPEVAGAIALLEATWPILRTNGNATAVLFASAHDLGVAGVDGTFGNGLLDLTAAFKPVGQLAALGVGGQSVATGSGGGTVTTSGALGTMSALRSQLSQFTAFDSFERNFTVNLSGLISVAATSSNAQPSLAAPTRTTAAAVAGGRLLLVSPAPVSFAQGVFGDTGGFDFNDRMQGHRDRDVRYVEFAAGNGGFVALGHGVSSGLSFAKAAWGAGSLTAQQSSGLGVTSALADLAQGGDSATAGAAVFSRLRVAATVTTSPAPFGSAFASDRARSDASAVAVTVTARVTPRWSIGATFGRLSEDNALLGSTYNGAGPLTLGAHHTSRQLAVSAAFDLGGRRAILAEAAMVDVDGARMTSGLISDVSPLKARAYGVSFVQGDALISGDSLSIALRKPLRVVSGSASLAISSVDSQGLPVTVFTPVSLAPSGSETDLTLGYATPTRRGAAYRASVSLRQDADNQAGRGDVAFKLGVNLTF